MRLSFALTGYGLVDVENIYFFGVLQVKDVDFFHEMLGRLKVALRLSKDKEVAEALGLSDKAFNARKTRLSFPEKELRALAQQRPELGIDVDYVLTGVGRSAVTSAAATGWLDDQKANTHVAQRLAQESGGLMGSLSVLQAAARAVAPAPSEEALLLAAFRAADTPGRAAMLLVAQGIAALYNVDKAAASGEIQ